MVAHITQYTVTYLSQYAITYLTQYAVTHTYYTACSPVVVSASVLNTWLAMLYVKILRRVASYRQMEATPLILLMQLMPVVAP